MRQDKAAKYMQLARYQANLFSKDPSTKVGALFLAPHSLQVLTAGYNGFPRGVDETKAERWERPQKLMYVSHAEANGIANSCRHGTPLENSIAVVTMFPCATCAKLMIQAGISRIVTPAPDMTCPKWGEEFRYSLEMLQESGVVIQYVSPEVRQGEL
jgi:dCMP deaminase